ncbi:uroplakin-2 isoform X2 [Bufo bufo]|uniref:uroplakin-2 isoform X2 n=1 Tax=Bufo bufo TaxID=8384 RepID=UPI001ABDB182|nr:uroplakin-2 isoform X2 [Bufo bufo]
MQLLIFPALLLLISTSNGLIVTVNTSITNSTFNPLVYSAIIDLPPCQFSNQNAMVTVKIQNNGTTSKNFTVPQCRPKRDLIVVSDSTNGNVPTVNVGYQITNLSSNTQYSVWYEIGGTRFDPIYFTTKPLFVDSDVFRRSGGMVVITVLLSIAMFLLVIGLIAVVVLGGRGSK